MMQNTSVHAQSGNEIFRHITTRDGLSNSLVWDIIQDRHGFIWIAGSSGLDRYDGYNATTFRNDPSDDTSITGGRVLGLLEDENGYIWVGTDFGLSIFNPSSESFLQFRVPDAYPAMWNVRSIIQAGDGSVWAGSAAGLYRFSAQTSISGTQEVAFFGFDDSMESTPAILTVEEGTDGVMWVGTSEGMYYFDIETGEYMKPGPFNENVENVLSALIVKILKDQSSNIWISSATGLAVWRNGESSPEHVASIGNGTYDLTDAFMQSIFEDNHGNLWLGTDGLGAFKYNPETDEAIRFLHEGGNQNCISENDVHFVFEDIDRNVWFGYHNFGISVMYSQPWEYQFKRLTEAVDSAHPLNDIRQVIEDEAGNLWMATHQGLVMIPNDGSPIRSFLPDSQNDALGNVENHLTGFAFDGNQFLVGTQTEKFYNFHIEREHFTRIEIPEDIQFSSVNIGYAFISNETHFYLGSFGGNALIEINKEDLIVTVIEVPRREPDDSQRRIVLPLIGPGGNIYIKLLYREGLRDSWDSFLFDPSSQSFTKYGIQSPNDVSVLGPPVISKREEGVFWMITNIGILRKDVINNENRFLFQRDAGIVSTAGMFLFEDDDGFLWLGGAAGIVKLDPVTETLTFFEADPDRKPNFFRSASQLRNGDMVYSGPGGYVRFNPDQQQEDPAIQNIHITELRSGADRYNTLNAGINYEIEYSDNNISFTWLALNYRNPASTRYRYRLIGYDDEWTEVGTQRSVFLANLPPGDYTFQVQAGQRFGTFGDATAALNVAILPPWWRTLPAYFFFAFLLAGGIFAVDRIQRKRLINREREKTRERELAQAREIEKAYHQLEEAHEHLKAAQDQLVQQEKLASLGQLTAGIAHEIKNPLNFVNNFSEVSIEMIEEARDEVRRVTEDGRRRDSNSEKESPFEGGKVPMGREQGDDAGPDVASNPALLLAILDDIEANLRKIHEHGSRADGIVKSMLQHSRGGSGNMEPTNLNNLIKEYVSLAFHGMRAGKNPITVDINLELDEHIGEISLIGEDFSRVILNLCNNAFDAMRLQSAEHSAQGDDYKPKLTVRTKSNDGNILIEVEDNGCGIPDEIKEEILQSFFTTKQGAQGTGLGLSITHEIIKAHGGSIDIKSSPGVGTTMCITLTGNKK
jgi:signal transduction histidine kinase/ligand-binding sensor domain-containing protein